MATSTYLLRAMPAKGSPRESLSAAGTTSQIASTCTAAAKPAMRPHQQRQRRRDLPPTGTPVSRGRWRMSRGPSRWQEAQAPVHGARAQLDRPGRPWSGRCCSTARSTSARQQWRSRSPSSGSNCTTPPMSRCTWRLEDPPPITDARPTSLDPTAIRTASSRVGADRPPTAQPGAARRVAPGGLPGENLQRRPVSAADFVPPRVQLKV